jgi:hypothetical protein
MSKLTVPVLSDHPAMAQAQAALDTARQEAEAVRREITAIDYRLANEKSPDAELIDDLARAHLAGEAVDLDAAEPLAEKRRKLARTQAILDRAVQLCERDLAIARNQATAEWGGDLKATHDGIIAKVCAALKQLVSANHALADFNSEVYRAGWGAPFPHTGFSAYGVTAPELTAFAEKYVAEAEGR